MPGRYYQEYVLDQEVAATWRISAWPLLKTSLRYRLGRRRVAIGKDRGNSVRGDARNDLVHTRSTYSRVLQAHRGGPPAHPVNAVRGCLPASGHGVHEEGWRACAVGLQNPCVIMYLWCVPGHPWRCPARCLSDLCLHRLCAAQDGTFTISSIMATQRYAQWPRPRDPTRIF